MKLTCFAPALSLLTLPAALFAASTPLAEFPTAGNGLDLPVAFAVDAAGGVVVTGGGYAPGQAVNYVTVKFAAGKALWTRSYNGPANSYDEPKALVTDGAGNIYVTGSSRGTKGNDFATVKYGPDGQELWSARYDSGETDAATAIGVGPDGAVYVAGSSDREGGLTESQVLVKYSVLLRELYMPMLKDN